MMPKLYRFFRLSGYALGLMGLLLVLAGRWLEPEAATLARNTGWGALVLMFICFLGSYAVTLARMMMKR